MKIYIASSWKNAGAVLQLAILLREKDHEVDAFCDGSKGRYIFHWKELNNSELDAITFLEQKQSQRAFLEDKKWLDWADCCVLLLPAGNSSHLEAGYAKGCGKKLYIIHLEAFPYGEFDVMYGFADGLFITLEELYEALQDGSNKKRG